MRLRAVVWAGAWALVFSGVLQAVFPSAMGTLPPGLRTPVLALEIARSAEEMEAIFRSDVPGQPTRWVEQVDAGNRADFAFIVLYTAFLIFAVRAFESTISGRGRAAIALALLAGSADVVENLNLLAITARLGSDYSRALFVLTIATWVKWLSLAACLALLSPALRARGHAGRVAGWFAAASLPIALAAGILRGVFAELMLLAVTLAIVALWVEALRSLRAAKRAAAAAPAPDPS